MVKFGQNIMCDFVVFCAMIYNVLFFEERYLRVGISKKYMYFYVSL